MMYSSASHAADMTLAHTQVQFPTIMPGNDVVHSSLVIVTVTIQVNIGAKQQHNPVALVQCSLGR